MMSGHQIVDIGEHLGASGRQSVKFTLWNRQQEDLALQPVSGEREVPDEVFNPPAMAGTAPGSRCALEERLQQGGHQTKIVAARAEKAVKAAQRGRSGRPPEAAYYALN